MASEKLIQQALRAAMEARAAKHVADPAERAANLAKWQTGTPQSITDPTWYHGTNANVDQFKTGRADATFVTQNPDFANEFARGRQTHQWDEGKQDWVPRESWDFSPNVMPVHVRAQNPFDYDNAAHIKALRKELEPDFVHDPELKNFVGQASMGDWGAIESPPIQNALKALGHDSFFVNEEGNKNLAVYDPNRQFKSATGNTGLFDPEIPRLDENRGGEVEREHHADGERVRGSVNLDDVRFVSPERMADPKWDPRQIFEGNRRPMLPQDAGISGGGKAQTEGGELSTVALSPGMNVGPLSAGPLLVGTKSLDQPIVGYRVGTQLPEGFSANYSTSHPTNVPTKYSSDTLSLAKDILGMQVAAQLQSQGGKHGYGVNIGKGDDNGQTYLALQRPPMGGVSVMGGKEFRFNEGGEVRDHFRQGGGQGRDWRHYSKPATSTPRTSTPHLAYDAMTPTNQPTNVPTTFTPATMPNLNIAGYAQPAMPTYTPAMPSTYRPATPPAGGGFSIAAPTANVTPPSFMPPAKAGGGEVYQSTGDKLVDDGKINWGNPDEARDFFRADAEMMRRKKEEDQAQAEPMPVRRTNIVTDAAPVAIQAAAPAKAPEVTTEAPPKEATAYAPTATVEPVKPASNPILMAIRGAESRDKINAQNENSTAGGFYQFLDSTWANTLRRLSPEHFGQFSDEQLRALKTHPEMADLQHMAANYHLKNDIAPTLAKAGIPMTPATAYLSWFQGPAGAVKAYTAPDDATVAQVFPKTIAANAKLSFNGKPYAKWTMSDLRQWADSTMAKRMPREDGGLVDNAMRVVREHHADGEAVGDDAHTRFRAGLDMLGRSEDTPPMDPQVMGENWANAVRRFRENPVREGEEKVRPLELGARDVIGGAIAGDAPNTSYTTELRRRAADALVGSKGLPDSGTLGFGLADLPMVTGAPLQAADFAHSLKEGDYTGAALNAALPAAYFARKPLMDAGRRAVDIAREYAPQIAGAAGVTAAMTPSEAEAAKAKAVRAALNVGQTFDHPVSRTKLITPLEEMRPVFAQPKENITPRKPMDWSQMEGGVTIPATWDRTRGDRSILTEINGRKLTVPKVMEGGPLYMNWGDVQPERQIAASGQDIIKRMIDNAVEAKKVAGDKDVYLANVLMGLEGGDFSHMVADPLVDLARQRGFSKAEAEIVDETIRRAIMQNLPTKAPMDRKIAYANQMPSIMDPDLERKIWEMGGGYRSSIAKAFDTAALKKMGAPDVASVRYAATQPELLNSPNLASGFSIAKVDPEASFVRSGHTTYPSGMAGLGYQGGSQVDIPFDLFWRDFVKTRPEGESMAHRQRAFTMQMPMQKIDPEWVDTVSKYEQDVLRGIIPPR